MVIEPIIFHVLTGYIIVLTVFLGVLWCRVNDLSDELRVKRPGGAPRCDRCGGKAELSAFTWCCPSCRSIWEERVKM